MLLLAMTLDRIIYSLTLSNDAVHESHGEAEEDEVMQVVDLDNKMFNLKKETETSETVVPVFHCEERWMVNATILSCH